MAVKDFGGGVPAAERCQRSGCLGSGVVGGTCLRHVSGLKLGAYLERLEQAPPEQRTVDLRGVEVTRSLWEAIGPALAKLGTVENLLMSNASIPGEFNLHGLTVRDSFSADGVEFGGVARIRACSFRRAFFMGSEFQLTRFGQVVFIEEPSFRECTFQDFLFAGEHDADFVVRNGVDFAGATFNAGGSFGLDGAGDAVFSGTHWRGAASFSRIAYGGGLSFFDAHFEQDLLLVGAEIDGNLSLTRARLDGFCNLEGAKATNLNLMQANLSRAPELGRIKVTEWAVLDQAVFEQQVRLQIQASVLHCHRTIFTRGVSLALAGDLVADGSFFPPPSDISGVSGPEGNRAAVLSMRRADVAGLTFSNLDLSVCLFAGVHHLERSRLGADLVFGQPPGRWRSPRDVLAEEQWLRRRENPKGKWLDRDQLLPAWLAPGGTAERPLPTLPLDAPMASNASSVADTYRALRKAREESKDSPGAASFYYGEMEMRREALRGSSLRNFAERTVLGIYWLLSGYGLRAWRSLATLVILLALSSFLLWKFGFRSDQQQSFRHAARVAVASATSLVRPVDDDELNGAGFAVEIGLRFAGPALLALSALAVRARIKR
jgi:uncharacterized protein YjbI with pentapeptide repeats